MGRSVNGKAACAAEGRRGPQCQRQSGTLHLPAQDEQCQVVLRRCCAALVGGTSGLACAQDNGHDHSQWRHCFVAVLKCPHPAL